MCASKTMVWGAAPTPTGDALKEEGMEQALSSDDTWDAAKWGACVERWVMRNTVMAQQFTGEWVRHNAAPHCGHPRHVNAWSAKVNAMAKRGIIADTGLMRKPADPKSHGRPSKIWMRV